MHAVTPRLANQTLFQHEVFRIISTLNAGSLWAHFACVTVTMAIRSTFFIFWTKRRKIVEILALLTTKLSSFKIYKVSNVILHSIGFNLK